MHAYFLIPHQNEWHLFNHIYQVPINYTKQVVVLTGHVHCVDLIAVRNLFFIAITHGTHIDSSELNINATQAMLSVF